MKSPYYVNLWGEIGPETAKYASVAALLTTLDELGIWQTTVSYTEGNAARANARLIQMIEETPGAAERVIPCFELQPFMFVSAHEMEHLTDCLKNHGPACCRIRPRSMGFRIRELEWMLEKLEAEGIDPVILVMNGELDPRTDPEDMELLTKRFPRVSFVIQRAGWSACHTVYDTMKRSDRIFVDNAALHTRDGLRMMVRDLGPSRVLFSLGPRGMRGAAMGALAWGNYPQELKDRIAWDNFEALFPEKDRQVLRERRRSVEPTLRNRFWKPFLNEQPIRDIPVIDAHTHIGPHNYRWMSPSNVETEQRDQMLFDMDRLGVDMAVASNTYRCAEDPLSPQTDVMKATEGHWDRFRGYLHFTPAVRSAYSWEYMEKMLASEYFIGLKTLPGDERVDIRDEKYELMFEFAEKYSLPILIHTWDGADPGSPLKCGECAKKYPHARLILGHTGGGT